MLQDTKMSEETAFNELPAGTLLLRNQYKIEKTLMEGGFGITYLARDSLDRQVVIKECFLDMLCYRRGRSVKTRSASQSQQFHAVIDNFLKEARRLAKLKHPNIVGVHQVFEENGTAYMAMDFIDGVDLLTLLESRPEKLSRKLLQQALLDTLDALEYVHDLQILHRDISPDNIMLDAAGSLKLIDFGAARDNCLRKDCALSALLAVKDGYSPHEFYLDETEQKTSSDLYSVAATFYHLITGEAPPDSQKRVAALASEKCDPYKPLTERVLDFDYNILASIDKCMSIAQRDRIQTAGEWLEFLDSDEILPPRHVQSTTPTDETLAVSIAELVEATNKDVQHPGQRVSQTKPQIRTAPEDTEEPSSKPLVDLFGNPIYDVDAWMQEQEMLLAAREKNANSQEDDGDARTRGPISFLFSQIFRVVASDASSRAV